MIKEFKNHKSAYTVLLVFLISFSSLFLYVWPDAKKQRLLVLFMAIFYFIWGVIVHKKADHITLRITLEYFAVAVLAGSILLLMTM